MLNRTNRTLSANLNRLNLGTRSLAILAGVDNGVQTLRTRHVHRVVMRDGVLGYQPSPIPIRKDVIPAIPSSPAGTFGLMVSTDDQRRVDIAAASFPQSGRSCRFGEFQPPTFERVWPRQERAKCERKPMTGKRLYEGSGLGTVPARAALASASALLAAAGG